MRPQWPKLASLAQKLCTLWFQFFDAFSASKGCLFKNIFENENEPYIWTTYYKQNLDNYGGKVILECNLKECDCTHVCKNNVFLRNLLTAWCKINQSETQKSISKQFIWNNSDIKCSNNSLYFKQWQEKDIKCIDHIYDNRSKQFITLKNCKIYMTYLIKIILNITTLLITL